ncbi:MAG: hypothetical protein IKB09_13580, partial [Oscillospiraceae bacterium]|nr:hypothetical protein [Oscillospiraceae bacterium]
MQRNVSESELCVMSLFGSVKPSPLTCPRQVRTYFRAIIKTYKKQKTILLDGLCFLERVTRLVCIFASQKLLFGSVKPSPLTCPRQVRTYFRAIIKTYKKQKTILLDGLC